MKYVLKTSLYLKRKIEMRRSRFFCFDISIYLYFIINSLGANQNSMTFLESPRFL